MYELKKSTHKFLLCAFRFFAQIDAGVTKIRHIYKYGALSSRLRSVGKKVIFDKDVLVSHPGKVVIGSEVFIGKGVIIISRAGVIIGNGVGIAAGCKLITWNHDLNDHSLFVRNMGQIEKPIVLEDGVWLGYNCVVLPGVTLRRGSVAAAGAVVTQDVPEYTVVGGVPAVEIKKRRKS